jgi:predicted ATPase
MGLPASTAALFMERAGAVAVELMPDSSTAPLVAAICRRLDGLPLAIELAAAWTRLLPLPLLLARLERRLPLLIDGAHDLPARQRTMRDAIAWSYDLLDASEQRLFRQLAVFVSGCTVEAAEIVGAEPTPTGTVARLAVLVDRSLLRRVVDTGEEGAESRLTILETIREYGLEQLEEHGEATAADERHAAYFVALAEADDTALSGPDGLTWRKQLALEHDNLRTALGWLLANNKGVQALRLSGALARVWSERGYLSDGRRWLREALAATADAGEEVAQTRVRALVGAATLAIEQADYDEAGELCAQAVESAAASGPTASLVAVLNAQGLLARARVQYADAARYHEQAHTLAIAIGETDFAVAHAEGEAMSAEAALEEASAGMIGDATL